MYHRSRVTFTPGRAENKTEPDQMNNPGDAGNDPLTGTEFSVRKSCHWKECSVEI